MRPSKKKRSRVSKKGKSENHGAKHETDNEKEKQKVLKNLLEAFGSVSLEEASAAYKEAHGDPNKAAEILTNVVETAAQVEDQSTTCSSSSGNYNVGSSSSSNASDVFGEASDFLQDGYKQRSRPKSKRVIASAGTVSTVLGKDYVRSTPMKGSSKLKGFYQESLNKEEAEQFLCSMLGEDCELSLAVVSDVFCQCGYNLEKALDLLLELSASTKDQTSGCHVSTTIREDAPYFTESDDLTDRTSESTSRSSEVEFQDNVWFTGNPFRNLSVVPKSSESHHSTKTGNSEFELPQEVLECLFNMPTPKTAEHEPNTMNWRNIVKQITSLGERPKTGDSEKGQLKQVVAKGDEYQVLREDAKQHWGSMKSYYQQATTAFSNGEKEYAAYLSEKGRVHSKMAREADEKASQDIFAVRNKTIENMITIDLHGQHIKQAMRLLKLHLLFGAYVQSVRSFRVITGCGSHGVGKSKLKNSVVNLLQTEGISWSEENRGTLLIRLQGRMNFSFLDCGSDNE